MWRPLLNDQEQETNDQPRHQSSLRPTANVAAAPPSISLAELINIRSSPGRAHTHTGTHVWYAGTTSLIYSASISCLHHVVSSNTAADVLR